MVLIYRMEMSKKKKCYRPKVNYGKNIFLHKIVKIYS